MVEPRRENLNFQDQTEKEIKSIWVYKQRECKSGESICTSSDGISEEEINSDSDLFDLDIEDTNYLINEAASKPSVPCAVPSNVPVQRLNLAIVPLDPISIKVCPFRRFLIKAISGLTFYLFIIQFSLQIQRQCHRYLI